MILIGHCMLNQFLTRTRLALTNKAQLYQEISQPTEAYLGLTGPLGRVYWCFFWTNGPVEIFTEELSVAGSAASLSTLLNRLDPVLRKTANLEAGKLLAQSKTVGYVEVVDELLSVQTNHTSDLQFDSQECKGEEEIPDGTVAVLTPDMPDVLSMSCSSKK